MAGRRPGPDPKGDRVQFTVRLPKSHLEHYRREAAGAGMPLTDYMALKLAGAHDLPEPAYLHRDAQQEALDVA